MSVPIAEPIECKGSIRVALSRKVRRYRNAHSAFKNIKNIQNGIYITTLLLLLAHCTLHGCKFVQIQKEICN